MDLTNLKASEFLELLASDAPAPGGGAAAALAGGIGVSLVEMVVSLTRGKEKFKEFETLMQELGQSCEKLRHSFNDAVNLDAEAFGVVSAAYKMDGATPEQKLRKKEAIQAALKKASDAPIELMELSLEAIRLCEKAVGRSNPNVDSDLRVSAVLLEAAAKAALINVRVNLNGINDGDFVGSYNVRSERLIAEISEIAGRIEESSSTS